jgi:hypothetical protein
MTYYRVRADTAGGYCGRRILRSRLNRQVTHVACNMSRRCQVSECRFPHSHITIAHRCGICHTYGHGQLECRRPDKRAVLVARASADTNFLDSEACTVPGCTYPWSHTSAAHHCHACGSRVGCSCRVSRVSPPAGPSAAPPSASPTLLTIECPHCKATGNVDTTWEIFTGAQCTICFDDKKMVVIDTCKHANICKECAVRLSCYS